MRNLNNSRNKTLRSTSASVIYTDSVSDLVPERNILFYQWKQVSAILRGPVRFQCVGILHT